MDFSRPNNEEKMKNQIKRVRWNKSVTPPTKLKTEAEVAELFGVSIQTMKSMRKRGNIQFVKVERCVRYRDEHIADYLERNTHKNNPPVKEIDI